MATSIPGTANHGIQATNVYGNAISAGDHPVATNYTFGADAESARVLAEAISRLEAVLATLDIDPAVRESTRQETRAMSALVDRKNIEPEGFLQKLSGIKEKLTQAGVVIADVVALAAPIRVIADNLKIPLAAVGL